MLQASCSNIGRARSLFERSLQADPGNMRARLGAILLVGDHCCFATIRKVDERRKRSCALGNYSSCPPPSRWLNISRQHNSIVSLLLLVPWD